MTLLVTRRLQPLKAKNVGTRFKPTLISSGKAVELKAYDAVCTWGIGCSASTLLSAKGLVRAANVHHGNCGMRNVHQGNYERGKSLSPRDALIIHTLTPQYARQQLRLATKVQS